MICSSGIGFDPVHSDRRLLFGFHGIWQGAAVLYDRQTNSHWQHLSGECIAGELKGARLKPVSGRHLTWAEFKRDYPEATVMAPVPQYQAQYYSPSAARRGSAFFPQIFPPTIQTRDERMPLHALVYGVWTDRQARAFPFAELKRAAGGVVNDAVGDLPVVVFIDPETGSCAAYERRLNGKTLTFRRGADGLLEEVESRVPFALDGRGLAAPFTGRRLPAVQGLQSEWYGWFAVHPETTVYEHPADAPDSSREP